MRFSKNGKTTPRYLHLYKTLRRVGKVAYKLELAAELAAVHPVFHISLLKKSMGDPASVVQLQRVVVKDSISYQDVLVDIIYHYVERLRNKEAISVKVLWRSKSLEGTTWEEEEAMKTNYHHLFPFDYSPLELIVPLQFFSH